MSKKLRTVLEIANDLKRHVEFFNYNYQELEENVSLSELTPEERFRYSEMQAIYQKLYNVEKVLDRLNEEVLGEGFLIKNRNNRYEVEGVELSSGYPIEVWMTEELDAYYEYPQYVPTRIEHNGEDYYIVELGKEVKIEGLKVRVRK